MRDLKKLACLLAGSFSLALLAGCGNNGSTTTKNGDGTITVPQTKQRVYFDAVGIVPLDARAANFTIRLNNTFDEQMKVDDIYIVNPLTKKKDVSLASLSGVAACSTVPAKNFCSLGYSSNLHNNGEFLIEAHLTNVRTGAKEVARQLVRVGEVRSYSGIEFETALAEVGAIDKNFSLALPVYIKDDVNNLKPTDGLGGKLNCSSNRGKAGTACTYLLKGKVLAGKTSVETQLTASVNGQVTPISKRTVVNTNEEANLIIGVPKDIHLENLGTNEFDVTIYNNGNTNAQLGELIHDSHITIDSKNNCTEGEEVEVGNSCTLHYKVDENNFSKNLNSEIGIHYDRKVGQDVQIRAGFVIYRGTIDKPDNAMLTLSSNGDFVATPNGYNRTVEYTLTNPQTSSAKVTVTELQASLPSLVGIKQKVGSVCNPASLPLILAPGETCVFEGVFKSNTDQTLTNIAIEAKGEYMDSLTGGNHPVLSHTFTAASSDSALNLITINNDFNSSLMASVGASAAASGKFKVENVSGITAKFKKFDLTTSDIAGQSLLNDGKLILESLTGASNQCGVTTDFTLTTGESCEVEIKYTPLLAATRIPFELKSSLEKIDEQVPLNSEALNVDFEVSASHAANITGHLDINNSTHPEGLFNYIPGQPATYTYIYTNNGGTAENFNVALNNIQSIAKFIENPGEIDVSSVKIKQCPVGNGRQDLATNKSCFIQLQVPNETLYNAGLFSNTLSDFEYKDEYSYIDNEKGLVSEIATSASFSVNVNDQWLDVDYVQEATTVLNSVRSIPLKITLKNVPAANPNLPTSLKAVAIVNADIDGHDKSGYECNFQSVTDSAECTLSVKLPEHINSFPVEIRLMNNSKVLYRLSKNLENFTSTP